jgi:hypothetical protein
MCGTSAHHCFKRPLCLFHNDKPFHEKPIWCHNIWLSFFKYWISWWKIQTNIRDYLAENGVPLVIGNVNCSENDKSISECDTRFLSLNSDVKPNVLDDLIWLHCSNNTGNELFSSLSKVWFALIKLAIVEIKSCNFSADFPRSWWCGILPYQHCSKWVNDRTFLILFDIWPYIGNRKMSYATVKTEVCDAAFYHRSGLRPSCW